MPSAATVFFFLFAPVFGLAVTLAAWHLWPTPSQADRYELGLLVFVCLSSVHVYVTIAAGWGRRCAYSGWGAMRGVALAVRYEIPLVVVFLGAGIGFRGWDIREIVAGGAAGLPLLSLVAFMGVGVFSLLVIEFNRAPFDLIEAESELVSGFNTEFGATGFVLLFLAEYAQILVGCQVLAVIFLGGAVRWVGLVVVGMVLSWGVLVARARYPRTKVGTVISACWKRYITVVLCFLLVMCTVFLR